MENLNHYMIYSFDLTIVVPLYNEAENLLPLAERLSAYLEHSSWNSCVLFVDDGSTDQSLSLLKDICSCNERFQYIRLAANGGLSTALKAGFDQATSPWCGYMDADLQTAPEEFELLLQAAEGYDLVTGIRAVRKDGPLKRCSSFLANRIRNSVTRDGIPDTGCPLKIIRTSLFRQLPFFKGMHRFLPALVLLADGKVKALPVSHFPRKAGKSKYHLWNRLIGPAVDLIAFRWMRSRHIRYHIEERG
ncbi:MAG: glycosyltransferase family 2 protein [Marinilabiliales bacterium]|nr:glycosyltransferase family 2 protein [Marinilabiliales bacterium]